MTALASAVPCQTDLAHGIKLAEQDFFGRWVNLQL